MQRRKPVSSPFIDSITCDDEAVRNRSFTSLCTDLSTDELLSACDDLESFRRSSANLYERVRATLFLHSLYRFHLHESRSIPATGAIPYDGFSDLLERRFEEAIRRFICAIETNGPNAAVMSALAECYRHLAFQTLADQVRRSVRSSRGNQWMFRVGHADDHPLRIRPEMLRRTDGALLYPVLVEKTPVRLDLSHSGWSDIFFLGMDYPEGARVLNISVDLGVYGRDQDVRPPVESYARVIPEPVIRLTSIDLGVTKDVADLDDLFNFGNDYLSLLKAGVIASGLVPPSFEGTHQSLASILERVVAPHMGIELVTKINDIPKGSRLAVSTNLLAGMIGALMRATGQTAALEGPLREEERRLVASRAILGEWLGGSGGGWQDSGGVWPGIKIIEGAVAQESDPEYGVSKGCLLPRHRLLGHDVVHPQIDERLAQSLVLVHGGMAQNVGPILEMVTEKYLLRASAEWSARHEMREIFDNLLTALREGDIRALAAYTHRNWDGPLKTIIPWVTNHFTESVIARSREELKQDFWGFQMLGGMSGGGMAMYVAPERHAAFRDRALGIMREVKSSLDDALPFAMEPVVYDFRINSSGTVAQLRQDAEALLPSRYYALQVPELVRRHAEEIPYQRRAELDRFTAASREPAETFGLLRTMVSSLFRVTSAAASDRAQWDKDAAAIKASNGFDTVQHEQIRSDLRAGRIGLAHNRLPVETRIEDVRDEDVTPYDSASNHRAAGEQAFRENRVAVLSLAGGVGSRWTSGAGVIKAVNPFVQMDGKHRAFLEIHLAKTKRAGAAFGIQPPHIVSTSFLTHGPVERHLRATHNFGYEGPVYLSPGRSIGQRLIPMVRDLVFLWEEMPQETLDEQKQKVRESVRSALMEWARGAGEGSDYVDNLPEQRFNPPGHWYEMPNLLRNGVLAQLLREHPQVDTIMLHNIDTLGADLDPAALGSHLASGNMLTFEVVPRRITDRGGGLARVNGMVRLLEGLAQPREEDELKLRYYNSMTTWIQIDPLLKLFGLTRDDLQRSEAEISEAVRAVAERVPTYVTIKDVKRRWGHGQEDVYPVAQFEKLWSDMTALSDVACGFLAVPRMRGQQLKDPSELDPWANDGSKAYVEGLCAFD
ncbi:MAG: UTP--glucose-1-phosphate uridylyltransferase [Candidatus Hydrogenedentes bacterium]|nr:UTP--glucose-1-phosphate uridylyltransferase [Candidatus Hydrogenedentota bacterium]